MSKEDSLVNDTVFQDQLRAALKKTLAGRTIIVSDSFVCISQQREVPASPTIVLNWICAYSDSHVVVKQ